MLGLNYYSYQYYFYQDKEKLNEILNYDSIGDIRFYEDEQIIEYKINRSKCFLLSDLIELIKIRFIRFHLGQLLLLFNKLLEKVKFMESHNIEHKYLSLDRIWLKFENNQYLTIVYKNIEYEIVFTGYENKFREDFNKTECADSKNMLQIISDIITYLKKNDIVCNKKCSSKNDIINKIYDVILASCQKQDIQDTMNTINQLLKNNEFDSKFQTISYDDKIIDHYKYSQRKHQQDKIEKKLQDLILKYDKNPIVLELFLFEKMNEMRINFQNWNSLDLDDSQEQQQYQKLLQNYEQRNQSQQKDACNLITGLINDYLKVNLEPFFKFEMDQSLKQNIIDQIMSSKIVKYFENSRVIYKSFIPDFYYKFLIEYTIPIIKNYVEDFIKLQIPIIIQDLI